MNVIICVDKNNGMLFFGKRLSMDSVLREKIRELAGESKLYLNSYSAKQFESTECLCVSDSFLQEAGDSDFCFIETDTVPLERCSKLYIFNWNRNYPADVFFDADLNNEGFKKIKKEEFAGNSHKKLTLEVYEKKE